jgi:two-component system response regulator YesN
MVPGQELENYVLDRLGEYTRVICESRTAKTNPVIEKAEYYIAHNMSSSLSLEDTARFVKVNPFYLSKLFKEETGQNFIDYLTNARMGKARELLRDTSLSIKEISHDTGYSDQNYFSKLFKKNFGFTPTEFRDSFLTGGSDA